MTSPTVITELRVDNIKRLQAVEIHPRGSVVEISGRNGQGKSSVLDSIAMALGGKAWQGVEPIRQGADKGKIVVTLDNGLTITRTITDKGGTLAVTSKDGAKFASPQSMLDKLVGDLSFDPLAFVDMKPADQRESLKRLVGVDTADLDAARQQAYAERTEVNRQVQQQTAKLAGMTFHQDAPEADVSVSDLMQQLTAAEATQTAYSQGRKSFDDARREESYWIKEIERLEEELAVSRERLQSWKLKADNADQAVAEARNNLIDPAPIKERIANSEAVNRKVRENAERSAIIAQQRQAEEQAERLTKRIDAIDQEKIDRLAAAKFPVDGLTFDESGVLFNGVPFSQASSAEQIRVSVAMGLAMNPTLKVILIRNGSLMDDDTLAMVADLAQAAGAQVWVERVDSSGTVGIVIEDGLVKTVNAASTIQHEEAGKPVGAAV